MTLGKILRNLREKTDKNQTEVSKDLKITPQAYSQYERDIRVPDAIMLQKLADYFNVSVDYLLGRNFETVDDELFYTIGLRSDLLDETSKNFIIKYISLDENKRKAFNEMMMSFFSNS